MVKLKCTNGDTNCNFETQDLEFGQATVLLESHLKHAHPVARGSSSDRKPEKFPRPEVKLDSSSEERSEFLVTWRQYKAEYNLEGASLIRQLFASCSEDLCHSLSRTTGGTHFDKTKKQLLELIKQLAICYQNPAVHVQVYQTETPNDEGRTTYNTSQKRCQASCSAHTCACAITLGSKSEKGLRKRCFPWCY